MCVYGTSALQSNKINQPGPGQVETRHFRILYFHYLMLFQYFHRKLCTICISPSNCSLNSNQWVHYLCLGKPNLELHSATRLPTHISINNKQIIFTAIFRLSHAFILVHTLWNLLNQIIFITNYFYTRGRIVQVILLIFRSKLGHMDKWEVI